MSFLFLAICAILGADIAAVKLDKNMPKENSARKSVVQLGREEVKPEPPQDTKETVKEKKTAAPKPKVTPSTPSSTVTNSRSKRPSRSLESSTLTATTSAASKPNLPAKEKKSQILYCLCREPERPGLYS